MVILSHFFFPVSLDYFDNVSSRLVTQSDLRTVHLRKL